MFLSPNDVFFFCLSYRKAGKSLKTQHLNAECFQFGPTKLLQFLGSFCVWLGALSFVCSSSSPPLSFLFEICPFYCISSFTQRIQKERESVASSWPIEKLAPDDDFTSGIEIVHLEKPWTGFTFLLLILLLLIFLRAVGSSQPIICLNHHSNQWLLFVLFYVHLSHQSRAFCHSALFSVPFLNLSILGSVYHGVDFTTLDFLQLCTRSNKRLITEKCSWGHFGYQTSSVSLLEINTAGVLSWLAGSVCVFTMFRTLKIWLSFKWQLCLVSIEGIHTKQYVTHTHTHRIVWDLWEWVMWLGKWRRRGRPEFN